MTVAHKRWYHSARWHRRRSSQLKQHPLCCYCQALGDVVAATVADHVIPHRGDAYLFWNGQLQSLCPLHHSSSKQSEEIRGYGSERGLDGVPVDPLHPINKKKNNASTPSSPRASQSQTNKKLKFFRPGGRVVFCMDIGSNTGGPIQKL